jgi:isopentenyl phosphate kinase
MLVFLKLGGSLITDKSSPHTPRLDVIDRLAGEIAHACRNNITLSLVIGHGSGSFGHYAGSKYHTRDGVNSPFDWLGFSEVWKEAHALNQIVLDALLKAGLPVMLFPPSAGVITKDRHVISWDVDPLQLAVTHGMIPLVNGDVVFDVHIGGTILSTEEAFIHLAPILKPERILLAGMEPGVWADFPVCTRLVERITPKSYLDFKQAVGKSKAVDVTGGMAQKVESMLSLLSAMPHLESQIFSGEEPGQVFDALLGAHPGTTTAL